MLDLIKVNYYTNFTFISMILLFVVFGQDIKYYQQAYYAIYTALKYKDPQDVVLVLTQDTGLFKQFDQQIQCVELSEQTITQWQEPTGYVFRVKIKAIQYAFTLFDNKHVLFFDTDVFIAKTLSSIKNSMDQGHNFLHLNEGRIQDISTKTGRLMFQQLNTKTFCDITVGGEAMMYNSGVIGINSKSSEILEQVLCLCDQMYPVLTRPNFTEQVAFSLVLAKVGLLETCEDIVGHYWGNKQRFELFIAGFLLSCFMQNLTHEQILARIDDVDYTSLPIYTEISSTKNKLIKVIDKMFPIRQNKFFTTNFPSNTR